MRSGDLPEAFQRGSMPEEQVRGMSKTLTDSLYEKGIRESMPSDVPPVHHRAAALPLNPDGDPARKIIHSQRSSQARRF
jgi:hypothetical protein